MIANNSNKNIQIKEWYYANKNSNKIGNLIRHTGWSSKEVYLAVHDKTEENCLICDKKQKFISLNKGFSETCGSVKCGHEIKKLRTYEDKTLKGLNETQIIKLVNDHITYSKSNRSEFGLSLKSSFPMTDYSMEEIYNIYYNKTKPICKYCGNKREFINFSRGYNKTCASDVCRFKQINSSSYHNHKIYTFKSGRQDKIQGYENKLLDELVELYDEDDIITDINKIPVINYYYCGKYRLYFPDVFVKSTNTLYEVKSTYTYVKEFSKNLAKEIYASNSQYNFEFKIY